MAPVAYGNPTDPTSVNQVLTRRLDRSGTRQYTPFFVASLLAHGAIVASAWLAPNLFTKPPEPFQSVAVVVVPPAILGTRDEPTPPPPPQPRETPPPPKIETPPPPPPAAEPEPGPVLTEERPRRTTAPTPPPPQAAPPPPPRRTPPPRRSGSPFGNPLGSSQDAVIGVEDPNFTYGFYINRVVALISAQWSRPPVGSEIVQAVINFDILADGTIAEIRLVESSGSQIFDDQALRAVQAASPMPPLPKKYAQTKDHLGISLIVR